MRRKLVLINSIVIFLSLVLFLFVSSFIFRNINRESTSNNLKNQLVTITNYFDGTNSQETKVLFTNSNPTLRLTILNIDGSQVLDSWNETNPGSRLNRPEIIDIGSIHIRYSDTTKTEMMYIATIDNGFILRLALPLNLIDQFINNYFAIGILALLLIFSLSLLVLLPLTRSSLKPLNDKLASLSKIAGDRKYLSSDSIEELAGKISEFEYLIRQKLNVFEDESVELDKVFNSMNQGLIVVSNDETVLAVNDYAVNLFKVKKADILNKNYIFLIREITIQEKIKNVIFNKNFASFDLKFNNRTIQASFIPFNNLTNNKLIEGIIITLNDVTELRNIENIKREFFANASHELKSPLTSILGYQQMIKEGVITSTEDVKQATEKTIKEVTRMNQMVIEMIELSKLESNQEGKIEDVRLDTLIKEITDRYKKQLDDNKLTLNLNLTKTSKRVSKNYMEQLFANLIDNAIKYNKPNGSITIELTDKKFFITDTGLGIASEHVSRVFERFYRVDMAKSKDSGGTGLGLAIVKHVCSHYNFKINLESQIKSGTKVSVEF
jgi:two-component system, OmpR family, phosphate regulon sensor histidine kinase PhoR